MVVAFLKCPNEINASTLKNKSLKSLPVILESTFDINYVGLHWTGAV